MSCASPPSASIARHWDSLSTLRSEDYASPRKTRSLPGAGQALPGGIRSTRRVAMKGFRVRGHFLLSRAYLTLRHPISGSEEKPENPGTDPGLTVPRIPSFAARTLGRKTTPSGHFEHAEGECPTLGKRWVFHIPRTEHPETGIAKRDASQPTWRTSLPTRSGKLSNSGG
jgi:hypothetical protein